MTVKYMYVNRYSIQYVRAFLHLSVSRFEVRNTVQNLNSDIYSGLSLTRYDAKIWVKIS